MTKRSVALCRKEIDTLIACVRAERELLAISGDGYTGPLSPLIVELLLRTLQDAETIVVEWSI